MSRHVVLDIHLAAIRGFLDRVLAVVDGEVNQAWSREEAGEFEDEDDFDNALFGPFMTEEIALRAVLHELNSLVESELQSLASEPFHRRNPSPNWLKDRQVHDLHYPELKKLIESHYAVRLDDLPGSGEIEEIRRKINAFKHRAGFKDPRKDKDWKTLGDKVKLDREEAHLYLQSVSDFLRALWAA